MHFNLIIDEHDKIIKMLVPEEKSQSQANIREVGSEENIVIK